jgi:hypothetical protein
MFFITNHHRFKIFSDGWNHESEIWDFQVSKLSASKHSQWFFHLISSKLKGNKFITLFVQTNNSQLTNHVFNSILPYMKLILFIFQSIYTRNLQHFVLGEFPHWVSFLIQKPQNIIAFSTKLHQCIRHCFEPVRYMRAVISWSQYNK